MSHQDKIFNSTLNSVLPARPVPNLPDKSARDYGLSVLADYISLLRFHRTNAPGQPSIPFTIPRNCIHTDQPDDPRDLALPSIGFIPGVGRYEVFGLGPPRVIEESKGVFGPGTVLRHICDYIERITIEVWASKIAERRAIVAGLATALRASDASSAVYLKQPDYFGMPACFSLLESQSIDDDGVAKNRRRAFLMVEMTVCEVSPVNVVPFRPRHEAEVLDADVPLIVNSEFKLER